MKKLNVLYLDEMFYQTIEDSDWNKKKQVMENRFITPMKSYNFVVWNNFQN